MLSFRSRPRGRSRHKLTQPRGIASAPAQPSREILGHRLRSHVPPLECCVQQVGRLRSGENGQAVDQSLTRGHEAELAGRDTCLSFGATQDGDARQRGMHLVPHDDDVDLVR